MNTSCDINSVGSDSNHENADTKFAGDGMWR